MIISAAYQSWISLIAVVSPRLSPPSDCCSRQDCNEVGAAVVSAASDMDADQSSEVNEAFQTSGRHRVTRVAHPKEDGEVAGQSSNDSCGDCGCNPSTVQAIGERQERTLAGSWLEFQRSMRTLGRGMRVAVTDYPWRVLVVSSVRVSSAVLSGKRPILWRQYELC